LFLDGAPAIGTLVAMLSFASRLRQKAEDLRLSNAEVARLAGLSERRYAHYVNGRRQPDFATLVRIAEVLGTSPNWLLGWEKIPATRRSDAEVFRDRLQAALAAMATGHLEIMLVLAEALLSMERRDQESRSQNLKID
jgi:transcriptional regulator with XRE-family HTH domain